MPVWEQQGSWERGLFLGCGIPRAFLEFTSKNHQGLQTSYFPQQNIPVRTVFIYLLVCEVQKRGAEQKLSGTRNTGNALRNQRGSVRPESLRMPWTEAWSTSNIAQPECIERPSVNPTGQLSALLARFGLWADFLQKERGEISFPLSEHVCSSSALPSRAGRAQG